VLHAEDVVEEIATGRRGQIDNIHSEGVLGQEPIPNLWRVHFSDGKEPLWKSFKQENELRLITCPHADPEPGFAPTRPIMDPPY
jgi:hypothetical protein